MKNSFLAVAFLMGMLVPASAGAPTDVIDDFRLLDQNGASHELYRYSDQTAVVLISEGNGCPIFQQSVARIRSLRDRYASKGVAVLLLNANPRDSREDIAKEAARFGIDIPILHDESQSIAQSLGISRTPEALVIDPKRWRIVYRGPIDDRLEYGEEKPAASRHYLADAIEALLAGRKSPASRTNAPGCLIPFEKAGPISYTRDVAPILAAKCLRCHSEDSGPAPMTSYARVRGWAPMIRETIRTGRMPPAPPDIHVGEFEDNPALTPREARTVLRWTESEGFRGEGSDPLSQAASLPKPEWPSPPDMVLTAPEQEIPANGDLSYRYMTLSTGVASDLWLKAVAIKHSRPNNVHHSLLYVLPEAERWDPTPRVQEGMALMTPQRNAYLLQGLPEKAKGTVQFVARGSKLILECHYRTTGKKEVDRVSVGFYLDKRRDSAMILHRLNFANADFLIPPGKRIQVRAEKTIDRPMTLYGLFIHMHTRGSSAKLSARYPNGAAETLLSLPNYDFHWERHYHLMKPKRMPAGTTFVSEGTFDNSAQNPNNPDPAQEVHPGFRTTDEMFFTELTYTDAGKAEKEPAR